LDDLDGVVVAEDERLVGGGREADLLGADR